MILCTGAGGFKPNGFPICDLTHDGSIMAYNIGARITGKEWNDGHPGRSTNPAACFDGWGGMFEQKPGTTGIGIRHDLGVESNYQAYMLGNPVSGGPGQAPGKVLDGGPCPSGRIQAEQPGEEVPEAPHLRERVPGKVRTDRGKGGGPEEGGAPPGMGGMPVGGSSAGMAIHKSEGLVPINDRCESDIPGLYAAGDALGSYMAGAIYTQIGSSLAGSAVQGAIAAEAAAEYSEKIALPLIPESPKLILQRKSLRH